jgi:hypothetical protein
MKPLNKKIFPSKNFNPAFFSSYQKERTVLKKKQRMLLQLKLLENKWSTFLFLSKNHPAAFQSNRLPKEYYN